MPNQYSHSVVLAHYSSLGLIDLPNDQYIAYLKTYPSSALSVAASTSRSGYGIYRSHGSVPSSPGSRSRYRSLDDHSQTSTFVTPRREYNPRARDLVVDMDDLSEDDQIIIHANDKPPASRPRDHQLDARYLHRPQTRPYSSSIYTGRSSGSDRSPKPASKHIRPNASPLALTDPIHSQPTVISHDNSAPTPVQARKSLSRSRQPSSSRAPIPPLPTSPHSGMHDEPDFGLESDPAQAADPDADAIAFDPYCLSANHPSQATITPSTQPHWRAPPSTSTKRMVNPAPNNHSSSQAPSAPLDLQAKQSGSASRFARPAATETDSEPRRIRSYGSISSITTEDVMHLASALPSSDGPNTHNTPKLAQTTTSKSKSTPNDTQNQKLFLNPSFLQTSPDRSSAPAPHSAPKPRSSPPRSNPAETQQRTSLQGSQPSVDLAVPNPDFWRDLEDLLSDSDASVVFPPDIAKRKPRTDSLPATAVKNDKHWKKATRDIESKKTPAPAPLATRPATRDTITDDGNDEDSLGTPDRRGRASVRFDNPVPKLAPDGRPLTTVNLVDTSAPKGGVRKGFLNKLRKRNRHPREEKP